MITSPSKVRIGIQSRVLIFALGLALPALALVGWLSLTRLTAVRDAAISQSENTLLNQAEKNLSERASDKAQLYDQTMNTIQRQILGVHDVAVRAFTMRQDDLPALRDEPFWTADQGVLSRPAATLRLSVNQAQVVADTLATQVQSNPLLSLGYIGLANGVALFNQSDIAAQLPAGFDVRQRDWYRQAERADGPIWTDTYVDAVTGDLAITAAIPVRVANRLIGVIGFDVLLNTLRSDILQNPAGTDAYGFLMTDDGDILVRPDMSAGATQWNEDFDSENFFETPDPVIRDIARQIRRHQSGVVRIELREGERYLAYAPMQTTGWVVGLVLPLEEVVEPARDAGIAIQVQQDRLRSNLLAIIAIIGTALVLLALGLGRTIIRPLRVLDAGAQLIAAGHFDQQLPVTGNDEIGRLSMSFNAMTLALQEKLFELEDNAQQLAAINEVSNELKRQRSLAAVLQKIPELLCARLGFDRAVLYLVRNERLEAASVTFGADNEVQEEQFIRAVNEEPILLAGTSIEAGIVRSRQTVIVDNPWQHPNVLRRKQNIAQSRSYVQTPIVGRDSVLGVLSADFFMQNRNVTIQDASLLLNFADMVGLTIENALSFQNLENLVEQRTSELRDALDRAHAADRLKSQFLASVSHELRTPLNAIIGFSTVLIDELGTTIDAAQNEDLETINNNGRYLLDLINDILDMARIEAGKFSLRRVPTSVRETVDSAVSLLRALMASKPVAIRVDVSPQLAPMDVDPTRLRQMIINLLSNALRFTDTGQIVVRATRRVLDAPASVGSHTLGAGDWIIISVQDTGIGMDAEAVQNLFQEFRQVHAGARGLFGSGLGLSITRRLVDLHHGELWVDSKVGVGSTFSIAIATAAEQVEHAELATEELS